MSGLGEIKQQKFRFFRGFDGEFLFIADCGPVPLSW